MKHMERFKKMTTIAFKLDCIKKDPFAFFRANFNRYDRPFLSIEELLLIEDLSLRDRGLQCVRDVFVFACYTGLSYIDVKQLKPEHVVLGMDGEDWIFTRREKSETFVKIPLLEKAKAIMSIYADQLYGEKGDLLLPVYSNQKCNKYLKTIDVRKMTHPLYPLVEQISTLHLDLLAREQGLESGSPIWLQI